MRSSTPRDLKGRCRRCFMPEAACVCALASPRAIPFEVRVLRHQKETWKTSNTARLAALALSPVTILEYGRPHEAIPPPPDLERTWLLFPEEAGHLPPGRPDRLIVLDGTWGQARRMARRVEWLQALPRLSLVPGERVEGLRRQSDPLGMPTAIAIARALDALGETAAAASLERLHAEFVSRMLALRGGL